MPLIDDRGRLFGKVNLIDALVGLVALGLIPLAYGAYLLFRVPAAKITSIDPKVVIEHQPGTLRIVGEDLRPYLHARIGSFPAKAFLIQNPTLAEIQLPDLPAGTYDVALSDEGQEILVVPGALTVTAVTPPPPPAPPPAPPPGPRVELQAVGAFVGLAREEARLIRMGSRFPRVAEVLAVRPPERGVQRLKLGPNLSVAAALPNEVRVPAIIRLTCVVVNAECRVGDAVVAQNAIVSLPLSPSPSGANASQSRPDHLKFLVDEIREANAPPTFPSVRTAVATVRVRFAAEAELLDLMKPGDVDVGRSEDEGRAVLVELGTDRQPISAQTLTDALQRSYVFQRNVVAFTGTVRLPVVFTPTGWTYNQKPVKVGAPLTFETVSGAMGGLIVEMKLDQETQRAVR